ncbi:MAG: type II toxin-antitoxin system RelE family toxin [Luteolibacter sp.]
MVIKRSAAKEIEALPQKDRARVIERIRGLAEDPRPVGCKKLSKEEKYRVRQRRYRILYQIEDAELIVTVVKVGHRINVYE